MPALIKDGPVTKRLLPSPIEFEVDYARTKMKRAAPSPKSSGGRSKTGSSSNSGSGSGSSSSSPVREMTPRQKRQLGLAKFWAAKAQSLMEPFDPNAGHAEDPVPLKIDYDGIIKSYSPQDLNKYDGVENHPPLSNDAIADILKKCKPQCPKAQAWINAHEYSKMARENMKAQMPEREDLRKQVLHKLRMKTLEALKEANASKEQVREVLASLPAKADFVDGSESQVTGGDEQMARVIRASKRLQNVMLEKGSGKSDVDGAGGAGAERDEEEDDDDDETELSSEATWSDGVFSPSSSDVVNG